MNDEKLPQSLTQPGLETFYARVAAHFPNPIVRYDRECRKVYANPAMLAKAGQSAAEFLGQTPAESTMLRDPAAYLAKIKKVLATGQPAQLEAHLDVNGAEQWANIHFMPEWDEQGQVSGILAIGFDITQAKNTERLFHNLVESWPDEIARYDGACRRIYVNPSMDKSRGPAAHLLGRTPTESCPDSPEFARYEEKLRQVLATGEVLDFELGWDEPELGQRHRLFRLTPERNASGVIVGVFAIAHDISVRKRAEEALRFSEQQLRSVYENSPLAYQSLDAEGHVLDVNPAWRRLTGYERDEVVGRPFTDFLTTESADQYPTQMHRLKKDNEVHGVEYEIVRKDGSHIQIELDGCAGLDAECNFQRSHCMLHDITLRKRSDEALRRLNRALQILSSGNEALVRANSEEELLHRMCEVIVEIGEYRLAWIGFRKPDNGIEAVAWAGHEDGFLALREKHWQETGQADPAQKALMTGQVQVNHDIDSNPDYLACRGEARQQGFRSCLSLPLLNKKAALGVLVIYATDSHGFDKAEVRLLEEMAEDLAYGIHALRLRGERERFLQRLQATMESTIEALASTVEIRDPYTAGHQRRVADLAAAVARAMGWSEERVNALYLAGVVHDIGKIGIPAEILSNPGRLSKVQMDLIRTHADAGYDILKNIEFPWPIADIVHQHHERMDGSGYPLGLSGDDILMEARILAICDVVEAMTTHRPYRAGLGLEIALEEIEKGKGRLFDTEAAETCIRLLRSGQFAFI